MKLPERYIEIEELFQVLGLKNIRISGDNVMASCPFHKDNKPSFGVHRYKLIWNCYSCTRTGHLASLLSEVAGLNIRYCTKYIVKYIERRTYKHLFNSKPKREVVSDIPETFRYFSPQLVKKGFDVDLLKEWNVGYDPTRKAAVIFWRDRKGKLVGHEFKYFKKKQRFDKLIDQSGYLYGEGRVIGDSIIVVESPLDCVWACQHNLFNVVAIGASLSKKQIGLIGRYREVTLWLDNDNTGNIASTKIFTALGKKTKIFAIDYEVDKKDIGEMDLDEIWKCWRTRKLAVTSRIMLL